MGDQQRSIIKSCSELVRQVCRFSRLCYERQLVSGSGGNLSVRVPVNQDTDGKQLFIVTAGGVSLRDVAPENLVVVDVQGSIVEGPPGFKASKEIGLHLGVFTSRADAEAVIHAHPKSAVAVSSAHETIPLVTISAQLKLKQGPLVAEAPPGSETLRSNVVEALRNSSEDANVLLLENHGIVAWGSTLDAAFNTAELAGDTADIALQERRLKGEELFPLERHTIVDFSPLLNSSIHHYPTDPPFKKTWHTLFEESGVRVSRIEMGSHTGSHVDAPSHFMAEGISIADMEPSCFIGAATVIPAIKEPGEDLTTQDIANHRICANEIVLFRTGWEERAGTARFFQDEWPGLDPALVEVLVGKKVKAIGGDIASADSPRALKMGAPAHSKALAFGIPLIEGLVNLERAVGKRFLFVGLPLKIDESDGSPIRAIGIFNRS